MGLFSSCSDEKQGTGKKMWVLQLHAYNYCLQIYTNSKFIDKNHIEAVFHWLVIRLLKVIAPALNVGQ